MCILSAYFQYYVDRVIVNGEFVSSLLVGPIYIPLGGILKPQITSGLFNIYITLTVAEWRGCMRNSNLFVTPHC